MLSLHVLPRKLRLVTYRRLKSSSLKKNTLNN